MNIIKIQKLIKNIYSKKIVPVHEPIITKLDKKYVNRCLNSTFVSTVGKYVGLFEEEIKKFTCANYVIAVNSGTSALHVALVSIDIKKNDEVLLPSATYVSTANAIIYCGADPHFVDICENTIGVDPAKLEKYLKNNTIVKGKKCFNKKTKKIIKALIVVHAYGHPANLNELKKICKDFNLELIEDAAEAIGSYYNNKHVGTFGKIGVLSFNGNKTITTGGGGAIITNSQKISKKIRKLTTLAKIPHPWEQKFEELGYNYRMINISAALGCSQVKQLKMIINRKRKIAKFYKKILAEEKNVKFFSEPVNCRSNYWHQFLLLNNNKNKAKNLLKEFHKNKILSKSMWTPLHTLKYLKNYPKMNLSITNKLFKRLIILPSGANISENKLDQFLSRK
ncbi:MAG: aminotransferase DegT [Candidatus Marinimicrobia bacterium]|nr:aminotransferase DegT [Candidatus Neomarinimicrobiota bacterium]|tara:strand:+ start:1266 stop:2447 length:1182 start_codon:yes stop_codon:yes gene_type:complete